MKSSTTTQIWESDIPEGQRLRLGLWMRVTKHSAASGFEITIDHTDRGTNLGANRAELQAVRDMLDEVLNDTRHNT